MSTTYDPANAETYIDDDTGRAMRAALIAFYRDGAELSVGEDYARSVAEGLCQDGRFRTPHARLPNITRCEEHNELVKERARRREARKVAEPAPAPAAVGTCTHPQGCDRPRGVKRDGNPSNWCQPHYDRRSELADIRSGKDDSPEEPAPFTVVGADVDDGPATEAERLYALDTLSACERLRDHFELVRAKADSPLFVKNEDQTIQSLVNPLIRAWGYDPDNEVEVRAQHRAGRRGKIDRGIFAGERLAIGIEVKAVGTDFDLVVSGYSPADQIEEYLRLMPGCRIGLLTDGVRVRVYAVGRDGTPTPYADIDMRAPSDNDVRLLARFARAEFDEDAILAFADKERMALAYMVGYVRA